MKKVLIMLLMILLGFCTAPVSVLGLDESSRSAEPFLSVYKQVNLVSDTATVPEGIQFTFVLSESPAYNGISEDNIIASATYTTGAETEPGIAHPVSGFDFRNDKPLIPGNTYYIHELRGTEGEGWDFSKTSFRVTFDENLIPAYFCEVLFINIYTKTDGDGGTDDPGPVPEETPDNSTDNPGPGPEKTPGSGSDPPNRIPEEIPGRGTNNSLDKQDEGELKPGIPAEGTTGETEDNSVYGSPDLEGEVDLDIPMSQLPDTGGAPSIFFLVLGAVLLSGGLILGRKKKIS